MNNPKLNDKNPHKFIFFKVKDYETILAGRFDASNDFAYIQRSDGTILEKYERYRLEHMIEIPNEFTDVIKNAKTYDKNVEYEFKPFGNGPAQIVKVTGKIWEIGEHSDYKDFRVIEIIDENNNLHDAFEDELTNKK